MAQANIVAEAMPKAIMMLPLPRNTIKPAVTTTAAISGNNKGLIKLNDGVDFHVLHGDIAINQAAGNNKGANTASKYGGPTDIFSPPNASTTSGYKVPSKTADKEAANNKLFSNSKDSRDTNEKLPPKPTSRVRHAYNTKAVPTTALNSDNINMPRVGSVANAWTDVNTPERTKKVPNKESAKAINDNNTVQLFNASRLSVTAKE